MECSHEIRFLTHMAIDKNGHFDAKNHEESIRSGPNNLRCRLNPQKCYFSDSTRQYSYIFLVTFNLTHYYCLY